VTEVSAANAEFWNEPCGTQLARSIGIEAITPEALQRFDETYFRYYPYLRPIVDRAGTKGSDILEIGLGYGSLGQHLASRGRTYQGLDIAEEPVGLMQLRLQAVDRAHVGQARQGSALDLPFPPEAFDVVVSIGTLHHTGNLVRSIAEVRRVLRPGGRAVVMVYNRDSLRLLVERGRSRFKTQRGGASESADQRLRGRYDRRLDGQAAPHTDFIGVGAARRLFRHFALVRVERRNFDAYVLGGKIVPRRWFLGTLDRVLGLDLYITATK
jgi:SAM-dependent methyltransferase